MQFFSGEDEQDVSMTRLTIALRAVRLTRLARLVKLLRSPLFQQLSELISGLMIGIPWLVWVMGLLTITIYLMGVLARQVVGPTVSHNLIDTCGPGDMYE